MLWGLTPKSKLQDRYQFIGFISSGTYGRVYKAKSTVGVDGDFAIKKFKPERENDAIYTGISQSAIREMSLCAELNHPNIIHHVETVLQDRSIYMVFEYCEHDLLQIIHHHSQLHNAATSASRQATTQQQQQQLQIPQHKPTITTKLQPPSPSPSIAQPPSCHPWALPPLTLRSLLHQLLTATHLLHTSHILHRDLKPANILLTPSGRLKIGDLGLSRLFRQPPQTLYAGDKVVVTIWYRAPELLLGARHYTTAVDMWAVGCIFAELLALRPIFKGEEVKMERKGGVPWQKGQVGRILEVVGMKGWEEGAWTESMSGAGSAKCKAYPEWPSYVAMTQGAQGARYRSVDKGLEKWWKAMLDAGGYSRNAETSPGVKGFELLQGLLTTDPERRWSAEQALECAYFDGMSEEEKMSCFARSGGGGGGNAGNKYPKRKITQEDDPKLPAGIKRAAGADSLVVAASGPVGIGAPGVATGIGGVATGVGGSGAHGSGAQGMTTGTGVPGGRPVKRVKEA